MYINEKELKQFLQSIKVTNWKIPNTIDTYSFVKNTFAHIGSTDPILRDELILELLLHLIENDFLTGTQMKELLTEALSNRHLLYGLGREEDDSVFNRAFTLLIIEGIIEANNKAKTPFLSNKEILNVHRQILTYSRKEKDLRGYVEGKGWAHSTAHTADALNSLVHAKAVGHKELLEIMELIREKICVESYTYINNEEERLITTLVEIQKRKLISHQEMVGWVKGFAEVKIEDKQPNQEHLRQNRKMFFRSLQYRANKVEFETEIIQVLDEMLESYICR